MLLRSIREQWLRVTKDFDKSMDKKYFNSSIIISLSIIVLNSSVRHKKHGVPLFHDSTTGLTVHLTRKNQQNTLATL